MSNARRYIAEILADDSNISRIFMLASSSERIAIGLALDEPEFIPTHFRDSHKRMWGRLDADQRQAVLDVWEGRLT